MVDESDPRTHKAREVAEKAVELVEDKVPEKAKPHLAILLPIVIGAVVLGLLTWGASEIYEGVSEKDDLALLDQPVLDAMVASRTGWLNTLIGGYTQIGGPIVSPIIATIVVIVMCLLWRSWLPATLMVAAAIGSLTVTFVGKDIIDRVRPAHQFAIAPYESTPSFPSGHALNAVVVGGIIAYLLYRHFESRGTRIIIVVLAITYAVTMGASRVYLGHHWLTDVITGWLLGGAWLALVITTHVVVAAVLQRRQSAAGNAPPSSETRAD